ncbi:hypothetical protein CALCODRAFT_519923 [Calocera cornea HHB12733]|uniref:Uncharacterized protein n=1 Tax=Calocera cornea HHB12733 TaxID=1353952 RepID=A0A165DVJ3_9BASI|nr:hypothetical protein CALCODRAFT_519923 [Calocera cornea HHB12733]
MKSLSRRQPMKDLIVCDLRPQPRQKADAPPASARVHDMRFPEAKRGDKWKIRIEDLIMFRGAETVGLDDVPDPGYMDDSGGGTKPASGKNKPASIDIQLELGEKIEFKATAYFTKQQWPLFKHLASRENAGRKCDNQYNAAGSMKIRGVFRTALFLVPASKDHLTMESGHFWRYRVHSLAPDTLSRSHAFLERFRLLDFMTDCRDRDVALAYPKLDVMDRKIRPTQRSITWLAKQLRKPIKVPHLKTPLDGDTIHEQLRTHAAWIARYIRPMRGNIYNQYFNVPIRQWEEFAERFSSHDTVTSLTMTKTDSSSEEEGKASPSKPMLSHKRMRVDSHSESEEEYLPRRKRPVRTTAWKAPVKVQPVFDSDDEDEEEVQSVQSVQSVHIDEEDDIMEITGVEFAGMSPQAIDDTIENGGWDSIPEFGKIPEPQPTHEHEQEQTHEHQYEHEQEHEHGQGHEHRQLNQRYIWDILAANPSRLGAVPEDFRHPPDIADNRRWKCPRWSCGFAIDLDKLDNDALEVLSAAEYISLQPGQAGRPPNRARIVGRVAHEHYLKHVPGLHRLLEQ